MEAEGLCGGQAISSLSSNLQTIIKGTRQRTKSWDTWIMQFIHCRGASSYVYDSLRCIMSVWDCYLRNVGIAFNFFCTFSSMFDGYYWIYCPHWSLGTDFDVLQIKNRMSDIGIYIRLLTLYAKSTSVYSYSCSVRYFSASKAAMHPVPALVMAWRYLLSWTSPAANTPGMLVSVVPGLVMM